MDNNGNDFKSDSGDLRNKTLSDVDSKTSSLIGERKVVEEDETISLPSRRSGLARKMEKPQRKVMWNDNFGNQLAEVLEYQPSDVSDSNDEVSDKSRTYSRNSQRLYLL